MITLEEYGKQISDLGVTMNSGADRFGGQEVLAAYSFFKQMEQAEEWKELQKKAQEAGGEPSIDQALPF